MNVFATHLHLVDTDTLYWNNVRCSRWCCGEQQLVLGTLSLVHASESVIAILAEGNKNEQMIQNSTDDYRIRG